MNVVIRDALALQAIRPVDAALYLRAGGWEQASVQPGRASVWRRVVGGEEYEALLPMDAGLRDYALRTGELLGVVAAAEGRSQEQVYGDLLSITSDVTRIRITEPESTDGTLSIEENALIAQKTRDLMLAAACAATEHRAVWHSRKPAQAMEYVRNVRIGQTERGSYVITVMSRVPPQLQTLKDVVASDPPYERQVTQTLAEALLALDRAAEQAALSQQTSPFDEAIAQGVSANLCDAVVGIWGGSELRRGLEFAFTWAPARPVTRELPRRVSISADRMPLIREAGRLMRERAPVTDFELRGAVVKLERPEGADAGKATVIGLLDDRQVRVTAELGEAPYHLAVTAHDQGKTLRVLGTLMKSGRAYLLQNARDVAIEED